MKAFPSKIIAMFSCLALLMAATGPTPAKGPPAGECKSVCVVSADPPYAEQGQKTDILISGSGFEQASTVKFLVSGSRDASQILVTGVDLVVSEDPEVPPKLKAHIEVDAAAEVTLYDIEVQTLSGRKGKGTALFAVKSAEVFTTVDIGAAFYDRGDSDPTFDQISEEANPYDGPYAGDLHHPWTGSDALFSWDFDNWIGNTLEVVPRPCQVGFNLNDPPTAGRYDCFDGASNGDYWPNGGLISMPLAGMGWENATVAKNGRPMREPGFCDLLNRLGEEQAFLEFGATRYSLFFMEGCDVGVSCPITITVLSYSGVSQQQGGGQVVLLHPFHGLDGLPDIGRMSLTAFVTSMPKSAAVDELNVFTVPQDLTVGKFRIELNNVNNGALEAVCETFEVNSDIRFKTAPLP